MTFVKVKPATRSDYLGLRVSESCIRLTKSLLQRLSEDEDITKISILRDDEQLEIGIKVPGEHRIRKDGVVNLSRAENLKMPPGRYYFNRIDGNMVICKLP